jgi:uncharacterized protein YjlB
VSETIRIGYGQTQAAVAFVRDMSEDVPLLDLGDKLLRIPDGKGWKIWEDAGGYVCVTEYTPGECDDIAARAMQTLADQRAAEERLRESARSSRDFGSQSAGAFR